MKNEMNMTNAQRLFDRLAREHNSYGEAAKPYVTIGALKGYIEILADKFPEVDAYIGSMEDFMKEKTQ
jgi:hypothetical protein